MDPIHRVAVVIPTHNRKTYLSNLLSQLFFQFNLINNGYTFLIIIVVDGSTDGTLEMLENDFPSVHVVEGDGNWWYTKCMNAGFRLAQKFNPDFILTLNDDLIISSEYIFYVIKDIKSLPANSILGSLSVTHTKPHHITFSGVERKKKFPIRDKQIIDFMALVDLEKLSGIHPSIELPGRGMLIPNNVLKELNFFDGSFPQYHSDIDFCRRAIKKGFKVFVSYNSVIYSHLLNTSNSSTFIRISTKDFLKNFINPHSRKHLLQNAKFIFRHKSKLLFPLYYVEWLVLMFLNHFKVNMLKINKYES